MHNWRFSLLILILFVQICGFAEVCIAINSQRDATANRFALFEPGLALGASIVAAIFIRAVELQDQAGKCYV